MATPSQQTVINELKGLEAGIQKNLANFTFVVGGKTYTGAQALQFLQSAIASASAVVTARGALTDAIAADKRFLAVNKPTLKALRSIIALMYGDAFSSLAEFAIAPRKARSPMSAETKLLRAAKSRATRKKRGTLGKRQRAAIKGSVTGVVITPVVSATAAPAATTSTPIVLTPPVTTGTTGESGPTAPTAGGAPAAGAAAGSAQLEWKLGAG